MNQAQSSAFSGTSFRGRNEGSFQNDNSENLPQICCNKETQLTETDERNTETDQKLIYLDNIDSFLVVDQTSGKIDIMPANFEQRPRQLCQFDRPIKLTFNPLYGSLIILDERFIGFRRDYNWAYSIGTLLDRPGSKSVRVEIPCDEALELYAFFSAPQPVKGIEWSEFKHLSDFTDQLSVKTAENYSVSEKSSVIVKIADGRRLLNDLLVIIETLIETKDYIYPIFPHALAVMERLRFSLFPQHPYSVQKPHVPLIQRRITKSTSSDKFCKSLLHSEGARRLTFFKWPHTNFKYAIPTQMAEAGFFHQSNEMNGDRVLCYICNVCLVSWEPSDEP
ncbi:inhibitor of apoptosis domain-containing protein [Ditylenchus destructor]|uniref:Inhibitor of apoptosis domain-containing protein n=1 Tax=Ditylenchus destructor TaxID=166010 RepID=A0AAD4R7S7_9BILA|nr:inhibitor of apoptosis domain-containing protein [Ditylenchus destructor]